MSKQEEQQQQQYLEQNNDNENLCVVCCKNVEIYSIGVCDHPVCYECSTRMRVLCNQNECPICRGHMPKVIFTETIEPFNVLYTKYQHSDYYDNKYGLIFVNNSIKRAYQQLLEYRCQICNEPQRIFPIFSQLRDHMRKEHGLIYCELCVNNLKIFNFERRCYTKHELGIHRRKGDKDDKSHKGHPLCEFCDTRFMDSDELFRHLRRTHLFCHYCDADGKHQYYNSMDDLKRHFRDEHYLCEEGECRTMPLTAVFKTEIDLKAHIATEHSRHMSKLATKQARTLELEFTLAPRPRSDRNKRTNRFEEEGAVGYHTELGGNNDDLPKQINALRLQDFPALGNSTVTLQTRPISSVSFTSSTSRPNPFSGEDFPSLGGSRSSAVTITTNSIQTPSSSSLLKKKTPEVTITRTVRNGNDTKQNLTKTNENFPRLGPSTVHVSVNNSPKVSIHVNHNGGITSTHITTSTTPSTSSVSSHHHQQQQQQMNDFNVNQRATEAFPALGNTTIPIQPQWVQPKLKKQHQQSSKITKVAPAPQLPTNDLNQFPSLSRTIDKKKSNSVTVPVDNSNTWLSVNSKTTNNNNNSSKSSNNNNNNHNINKTTQVTMKNNTNNCNNDNVGRNKTKKQQKSNNSSSSALDNNDSSSSSITINETNNGVIKKRSELKIGELSNDVKPPPGFPILSPTSTTINNNNIQPPPGFESFQLNDLTFTNSSGQSYSIKPTTIVKQNNNYYQPKNFQMRNQNLIKHCNLDPDLINEFKSYSNLYKIGELPVKRYYEYCKCILERNFDKIFPELLVLLPDIDKQQELYRIYDGPSKKNLIICEKCKQVIFKQELNEHYNYHTLDSQFPSLKQTTTTSSTTSNDDRNNAWKK